MMDRDDLINWILDCFSGEYANREEVIQEFSHLSTRKLYKLCVNNGLEV